jgi:two-component system phosphate regulon sensor histidine kinase PhoR
MTLLDILQQFNVQAQCRRYGVPLFQCPHFLFVIMGGIIIVSSLFTYAVGIRYVEDPQLVALGVLFLAFILLVVGFSIVQGFERLAEASRLKSEFISIVSHQLRTPLTNLRWSSDMLLSGRLDGITEKQKEYFRIIDENTARMNGLVQDLLMVSRIEQGRLPKHPQEIFLPTFIQDIMKRFEHSAEVSQIRVALHGNSDNADIQKVVTDPSQLKIIIENLIENAIRYSVPGGEVNITISKRNNDIKIEVQDTGIGIPAQDQKFIFQKFFRADNARTQQPTGTGLGLHITKMLVQNLGGQIGFYSQENKGSTFWFTIPIKST